MWLKLCVLALCGICSTQSVEISPAQSIFAIADNSALVVNCTTPGTIEWYLEQGTTETKLESGNNIKITAFVTKGNENGSILTVGNVTNMDKGTYRCRTSSPDPEAQFELKVFKVFTGGTYFKHNQDAALICRVEDAGTVDFTYNWKKGDTMVSDIPVEGKQEFIPKSNGTLEIKHGARSFAGVYTCIASCESPKFSVEKDAYFYASPKVIPFDKSKNLMEKEKLMIECHVLGFPQPSIKWNKDGKPLPEDSRYILSIANTYVNNGPMEDARLEIKEVEFADGGEYECVATHPKWFNETSTQVILVRVKDQLAALWPFLGILAEVIILCTIIFIYEKKRNKDTAEEEDVNQDGAATEKQTEGVRHRGTNNPRA